MGRKAYADAQTLFQCSELLCNSYPLDWTVGMCGQGVNRCGPLNHPMLAPRTLSSPLFHPCAPLQKRAAAAAPRRLTSASGSSCLA